MSANPACLNALAKRDAAITSSEAGTTRDAIEVFMDLGGWPVYITDTAGIRETAENTDIHGNSDTNRNQPIEISDIERQGIARSLQHAKTANLVIWVTDITDPKPHRSATDAIYPGCPCHIENCQQS